MVVDGERHFNLWPQGTDEVEQRPEGMSQKGSAPPELFREDRRKATQEGQTCPASIWRKFVQSDLLLKVKGCVCMAAGRHGKIHALQTQSRAGVGNCFGGKV